jgi:biopolymer transport protein ExbD
MKFQTKLKISIALIDLTPLVDVIFLLLIFFIITSDTLPLKSLRIENPSLETHSMPLTTQLLLVMDAEHVIYLGSKKAIIDLNNLKANLHIELEKIRKKNGGIEPTLVLSVDRRVEYGLFLRLFSIAQECCTKLRLVYQPTQESSLQNFYN